MTITFGCVKFSVKNRYVTAYVEDIYEIIDIQSQEENCMILLVVDTQKGIKTIMIAGLQTDFCIDATIKSGFDHGYKMIIPEYSNSTFDNRFFNKETAYKYFNELIWKDRYGETVTIEKAVEIIRQYSET